MRNELALPKVSLLGALDLSDTPVVGKLNDTVAPYGFLDVAYGHSFNLNSTATDTNSTLVGLGVGLEYSLASNLRFGTNIGVALTDGPDQTQQGDVSAQMRITLAY